MYGMLVAKTKSGLYGDTITQVNLTINMFFIVYFIIQIIANKFN